MTAGLVLAVLCWTVVGLVVGLVVGHEQTAPSRWPRRVAGALGLVLTLLLVHDAADPVHARGFVLALVAGLAAMWLVRAFERGATPAPR
jgi:O-antigen/teichoic acid export membrane protein